MRTIGNGADEVGQTLVKNEPVARFLTEFLCPQDNYQDEQVTYYTKYSHACEYPLKNHHPLNSGLIGCQFFALSTLLWR
jgi:hypothetical protein